MYLHSIPVKMAAAASKAIWKLSLLTTEMWQETSLDIQKARRRLLCRHCYFGSPGYWTRGPGKGFEKSSMFLAIIFSPFLRIFTRTMESWRHRFFQNRHTPELLILSLNITQNLILTFNLQSVTKLVETLRPKVKKENKTFPPPSPPCSVVPLFELSVEKTKLSIFEWVG